jgi:DoxX-like family
MSVIAAVVSVLVAAILAFSAVRKLGHRPEVVATYSRVGVPEGRLDHLALILLAGAAGLALGVAWAPIGIAAASCVVVYFVLAVIAHIRADDAEHVLTPLVVLVLAVAALVLRLLAL